jgi:hypothetical protein
MRVLNRSVCKSFFSAAVRVDTHPAVIHSIIRPKAQSSRVIHRYCVVDGLGTFSDCSKEDMTFIGTPRAIAMTDQVTNLIFIATDSVLYRCSVTDGRVARSCWGTVALPAGGTRLTFGVRGF